MTNLNSSIEWTDVSWNPVTGCEKVSPGCDHCYAEALTERFNGKGSFTQVVLHPERLGDPRKWREPKRVFVNSMSDLFHADVPDEFIARVFMEMGKHSRHTFQILTKRHGRLRSLLNDPAFVAMVEEHVTGAAKGPSGESGGFVFKWPLPNVWIGVSVENQQWADVRIPALLETPAAIRFLSCEPLLGPLHLRPGHWFPPHGGGPKANILRPWETPPPSPDWVIIGGESGPGARPMDLNWARMVLIQCSTTPVFVKQLGTVWAKSKRERGKGGDPLTWPEDLRVREFPEVSA